jgi:hypothetical protein
LNFPTPQEVARREQLRAERAAPVERQRALVKQRQAAAPGNGGRGASSKFAGVAWSRDRWCMMIKRPASLGGAQETGLFAPFLYGKRSIYQDRLGTNIGNA